MGHKAVTFDTTEGAPARLVVEIPSGDEQVVQEALGRLEELEAGVSAQSIILEALKVAAEQTYFWSSEWQAKERAADQDIAEGKVRTFDTIEDMLDFLDAQQDTT